MHRIAVEHNGGLQQIQRVDQGVIIGVGVGVLGLKGEMQ
jgi:hypothetical protein